MILREQKSWTYGSYAALRRNRGMGYWQATFEGRTEVTDSALAELLHQIDRVRTETIPDSELVAAKGFSSAPSHSRSRPRARSRRS